MTAPAPSPRCSVALCTYNGARLLSHQLESILGQTRRPDELVVSDDASTDGTWEIIRRFAGRAPFPVRASRNERNLGVTRNFERAIRLCEGEWIALSDQDDVWRADKLQALESALADDPQAEVVFTDAEVVDEELRPLGYSLWVAADFDGRKRQRARRGRLFEVLLWRNVVTGATMALRARVREVVLPIPDGWVHDGWIALVAAATGRVAMLEQPLIKYRQHVENQIGVEKLTFSQRLDRVMRAPSADYARQRRQFEAARERLVSLGVGRRQPELLTRLDGKLAHLAARVRLPGPRWRRLPTVGRELLALNYHRYSSGWLSAFKDITQSSVHRGDSTSASV